nr:ABC transporter transmembrane domain-containing protein [Corynebacterium cystitidis]
MILVGIVFGLTAARLKSMTRRNQEEVSKFSSLIVSLYRSIIDIKSNGAEHLVEIRLENQASRLFDRSKMIATVVALLRPIEGAAANIATLLVLLTGVLLVAGETNARDSISVHLFILHGPYAHSQYCVSGCGL